MENYKDTNEEAMNAEKKFIGSVFDALKLFPKSIYVKTVTDLVSFAAVMEDGRMLEGRYYKNRPPQEQLLSIAFSITLGMHPLKKHLQWLYSCVEKIMPYENANSVPTGRLAIRKIMEETPGRGEVNRFMRLVKLKYGVEKDLSQFRPEIPDDGIPF